MTVETLTIRCSTCGNEIAGDENTVGETVRCKKCHLAFSVDDFAVGKFELRNHMRKWPRISWKQGFLLSFVINIALCALFVNAKLDAIASRDVGTRFSETPSASRVSQGDADLTNTSAPLSQGNREFH